METGVGEQLSFSRIGSYYSGVWGGGDRYWIIQSGACSIGVRILEERTLLTLRPLSMRCTATNKTIYTGLKCNKMALIVFTKDLFISEKGDAGEIWKVDVPGSVSVIAVERIIEKFHVIAPRPAKRHK
ncbi:hypothetical protein NPIL_119491 [Nephila pilipes]|uniref:Uncharacterized protein n=1 Tax=Nephila pilipes TaxID=299642 RepID=A0A8X6UH98_NEPPI|nr:hypothetical protein NPIL_119491 [Nephila pilipes]